MKYCTVTSYMSKGPIVISDCLCCAERKLLRMLFRKCMKKGYRPHQFTDWLHRKHGELVVERKNIHGDAISLPCVLCRKVIEKLEIRWTAHDGEKWVHSKKSDTLPPSVPTAKQKRNLGFRCNDQSECRL
jgi:hypothetical protein